MIIELSNFFNNPTLIELGPLKIQYYAVTWLLSALLIYVFLKNNRTIKEIGLNKDEVNEPNCDLTSAEFLKYPVLKFVDLVDCTQVTPKSIVEILGKLL